MWRESIVAHPANERNTGQAAHVKALTGTSGQPIVQTGRVVVDLVRAHTASKQGLWRPTTLFKKTEIDSLFELDGELGPWEVLSYLLHSLFLYARMKGDVVLIIVLEQRRLLDLTLSAKILTLD